MCERRRLHSRGSGRNGQDPAGAALRWGQSETSRNVLPARPVRPGCAVMLFGRRGASHPAPSSGRPQHWSHFFPKCQVDAPRSRLVLRFFVGKVQLQVEFSEETGLFRFLPVRAWVVCVSPGVCPFVHVFGCIGTKLPRRSSLFFKRVESGDVTSLITDAVIAFSLFSS